MVPTGARRSAAAAAEQNGRKPPVDAVPLLLVASSVAAAGASERVREESAASGSSCRAGSASVQGPLAGDGHGGEGRTIPKDRAGGRPGGDGEPVAGQERGEAPGEALGGKRRQQREPPVGQGDAGAGGGGHVEGSQLPSRAPAEAEEGGIVEGRGRGGAIEAQLRPEERVSGCGGPSLGDEGAAGAVGELQAEEDALLHGWREAVEARGRLRGRGGRLRRMRSMHSSIMMPTTARRLAAPSMREV